MPRSNQIHPGVDTIDLADGSVRYRVRFTDDKGKRASRRFTRLTDAKRFADKVRTEVVQGTYGDDQKARKTTLDEWTQTYLRTSNLRRSTILQNEHYYKNYIKPVWGTTKLSAIRQTDVLQWLADLRTQPRHSGTKPLAPGTVSKIYGVFRKIYLAAVDAEVLPRSQLPRRPNVQATKQKEVRYLTMDEVMILANKIDPRYEALVWVACFCGLRPGELAALRLDDLDFQRQTLRVDEIELDLAGHLEYGDVKTARSNRTIVMPGSVSRVLQAHVDKYLPHGQPRDLVFPGPEGGALRVRGNWRNRFFNPAVKAAGVAPFTPHDMRHTAASLMIANGTDLLRLAEILGHTDTRMIERVYGHLYDSHRRAAAEALDRDIQAHVKSVMDDALALEKELRDIA